MAESILTGESIPDEFLKELPPIGECQGKTIYDILACFGQEIKEDLKRSVDTKTSQGTSKILRESISFDILTQIGGFNFKIFFLDDAPYWKYVDQGVRGNMQPFANGRMPRQKAPNSPFAYKPTTKMIPLGGLFGLRQWASVKKISPYAVARAIPKQGIAPTNFYSSVVTEQRVAQLMKDVSKAAKNEVLLSVKQSFKAMTALQGETIKAKRK